MSFVDKQQNDSDLGQQDEALIPSPQLPPRVSITVQRSPQPPHVSNQNIFTVLVKNRRQITSLTAGLIVLLGSGVHTVWAFWEIYSGQSWHETEVIKTVGSWYIATIIGSAIAAVLLPKWSKKKIYALAALILLLSSLMFIARLYTELRIDTLIFCGRLLGGLANGIAYLTVITHAAENAVNQIRGVILRGIGYVLAFSLFIAGFTTNGTIENDFFSECIMGALNLFYSILALILVNYVTVESAPFLLQQSNDGRTVAEREKLVIATMVYLRNEKGETPKIRHDFVEMKHQLNEDELDSRNPFSFQNLRPMYVVTGVRVLSVCAKNLPFTVLIMGIFNHILNTRQFSLYALFLLLSCRFVFGMITMFFIDKFERKKYLYLSSIFCGVLLLITCVICSSSEQNMFQVSIFSYGIIAYFIFASMSIDCVGHVQTSEAFSYATKSWSITIATGVEHIVHILFIIVFKWHFDVWAFVLISFGLIVMGLSTLCTVPAKTKGLSLRQTRDIYRKLNFVFSSENV